MKQPPKKWIDAEFPAINVEQGQADRRDEVVHRRGQKLQAKGSANLGGLRTLTTHEYESKTLAKAFEEITGIKVKHDLIQEGDVVENCKPLCSLASRFGDGSPTLTDRNALPLRQDMNLTPRHMAGKGRTSPTRWISKTSSVPSSPQVRMASVSVA
jgi:glycerol transport system substrate-binding protein